MEVTIAIGSRARIGHYDVMLFTGDGRSAMLKHKFEVLAAVSGPLFNIGCIPVPTQTDECPDDTEAAHTHPATGSSHEDYVASSYGATVQAALKLAKMKVEEVTGEHHQSLDKPFQLEKGGSRRIDFDLRDAQEVDTAWLIASDAKAGIKCTVVQKGKHITVEPTKWGRGTYEMVVIKKNKSFEQLKNAAIFK